MARIINIDKAKITKLINEANSILNTNNTQPIQVGVLGDFGLDHYTIGRVDRISPEAPIPILFQESTFYKAGLASNVIANLQSFGSLFSDKHTAIGVLGNDLESKKIIEIIKKNNSTTKRKFIICKNRPTTLKTRFISSGQQILRVDRESISLIDKKLENEIVEIIENSSKNLNCLIIQDYGKGCLTKSLLRKCFNILNKKNILSIVDPSPNTPIEWYLGASMLKSNANEAEKLLQQSLPRDSSGKLLPEVCLQLLKKLNLKMVVVTQGKFGMLLAEKNKSIQTLPSLAHEVFDVTGAGDTVVSILGTLLARNIPLNISCLIASAAASVVISKIGTFVPSKSDIISELNRFSKTI